MNRLNQPKSESALFAICCFGYNILSGSFSVVSVFFFHCQNVKEITSGNNRFISILADVLIICRKTTLVSCHRHLCLSISFVCLSNSLGSFITIFLSISFGFYTGICLSILLGSFIVIFLSIFLGAFYRHLSIHLGNIYRHSLVHFLGDFNRRLSIHLLGSKFAGICLSACLLPCGL